MLAHVQVTLYFETYTCFATLPLQICNLQLLYILKNWVYILKYAKSFNVFTERIKLSISNLYSAKGQETRVNNTRQNPNKERKNV